MRPQTSAIMAMRQYRIILFVIARLAICRSVLRDASMLSSTSSTCTASARPHNPATGANSSRCSGRSGACVAALEARTGRTGPSPPRPGRSSWCRQAELTTAPATPSSREAAGAADVQARKCEGKTWLSSEASSSLRLAEEDTNDLALWRSFLEVARSA